MFWGNGQLQLAFQGVCDIIAIDNDLLQLQLRTRPGRIKPTWAGVVQVGLKWKATNTILFGRQHRHHPILSPREP